MRTAIAIALAAVASVATLPARADQPVAAAHAEDIRLNVRETLALRHAGATAAFSIDPAIAEVSASDGRVTLIARSPGATTISIVAGDEVRSFGVTVIAPTAPFALESRRASAHRWLRWQADYESSSARLTDSVELVDGDDRRTLRAYAVNVVKLDATTEQDADARSAMPAMSLEWRNRRNEVVLFDKTIEHSPLTLDGTTVRGAHVRAGGLELHAGVTSPFLYQNVFLSTQREVVLGASYDVKRGRSTLTPSVYGYPSAPQTGGSDGAMGSLMYRFASRDDRLQLRGELGWGGELGAAAEASYQDSRHRAWFAARHQPQGFAALGFGRPLGTTADAMWTAEATDRLSLNAAATAARYTIADRDQEAATATGEARVRLTRPLTISGGAGLGRFRGDAMTDAVRSLTVPIGVHLDSRRLGASATYRYQSNTLRNRGGHGGRLGLRARHGIVHAAAFADAQQEAATLELILTEEPALAALLNERGLTVSSPDDLARLLREDATLSQLGYVEGVNLAFHPWRAQAGLDVALLSRDHTRQTLRLRALIDETRGVVDRRRTTSASLSYGRRLGASVEATGMVSWWSRGGAMSTQTDLWSVAAGLRVRIDRVPRLTGWGRRDLDGEVVDERGAPVAGVTVRLDGARTATTDAAGRFRFDDVARGGHRVEAELPRDAYFTGPSQLAADAGASVRFTLARAAAQLTGVVRDDVGAGIAGLVFTLRAAYEAPVHTVTTDSSGHFRVALPPGDYVLEAQRDTLASGYDTKELASTSVHLEAGAPTHTEIVVPANRSIAGTVTTAPGDAATIRIVELDRAGVIDGEGRYVFRGLGPGRYTVEATVGGATTRRTVELTAAPTSIHGIDFP